MNEKEGNKKSICSLVSDLPSKIEGIDYSKGLNEMENLPKILLNDSRNRIISERYEEAENILNDYETIGGVFERRGFHYAVNGPLKNNYDKQREILESLKQSNLFYNNSSPDRSYDQMQ